jgi:hypothetical protein
VAAVGLVVAAWGLLHAVQRRRGINHSWKQYYRPRLVLSVILLLFYLYPSITNVVVGLLSCSEVDSLTPANPKLTPLPGTAVYTASYWMGETSVQCWTGPHLWVVVFLAFPYLVLFSVGFPLILVWRLYRHRYQLGHQAVSGALTPGQGDWKDECCSILYALHLLACLACSVHDMQAKGQVVSVQFKQFTRCRHHLHTTWKQQVTACGC